MQPVPSRHHHAAPLKMAGSGQRHTAHSLRERTSDNNTYEAAGAARIERVQKQSGMAAPVYGLPGDVVQQRKCVRVPGTFAEQNANR